MRVLGGMTVPSLQSRPALAEEKRETAVPRPSLYSLCVRLRNRDEFYDLSRAGIDEHYGVIAPEEVFYRATTLDHDDVRRQIVKHN